MKKSKIVVLAVLIIVFVSTTLYSQSSLNYNTKKQTMTQTLNKTDETLLYELNIDFIKNFITMDTLAHNEIIHGDFVVSMGLGQLQTGIGI